MNKFRLGIITGMSSLVVAVPLLAVGANAQSASSTDTTQIVPTQQCVETLASIEQMRLDQFDLMNTKRKEAMQSRLNQLKAAAVISDDTARKDALAAIRDSIKDTRDDLEPSDEMKTAMEAVKAACGDTFRMRVDGFKDRHPVMGKMMDKAPAFIADKLGMTADELKAALDSGKTIKDIAEEKGIDLPMPERGHRMMKFHEETDQ